jgi:hypothetical protein
VSTALEWFPKKFSAGDMEGELRLLGKPALSGVFTLLRETAQNSWDARLPESGSVSFRVAIHTLQKNSLDVLRHEAFLERGCGIDLDSALRKRSLRVMEISDRGTSGLDGPVRISRPTQPGEPTNFRDLVLAVGSTRAGSLTGGTYGFGKTISYLLSRPRTVLIWSHCRGTEGIERRLIGSAMGEGFVLGEERFTGRQWWGKIVDGEIEPEQGSQADKIAKGVFSHRFAKEETGTSILILDPLLDSRAEVAANEVIDAILWNLWPKMIPIRSGAEPPMVFECKVEGVKRQLPDPSAHPVLGGFVRSLQSVRHAQAPRSRVGKAADGELTTIHSIIRFTKPVGHLAITAISQSSESEPIEALDSETQAHHIALLRHDAELVVNYLPMRSSTIPDIQFCGVFRSTSAADASFAAAEPPAHDAWEYKFISDSIQRSTVKVALERMREAWLIRVQPNNVQASPQVIDGMGRLARELGFLVDGLSGTAAGPSARRDRTRSTSTKKPQLRIGSPNRLKRSNGDLVVVPFSVQGEVGDFRLEASAGIGFDGGTDISSSDQVTVLGFAEGDLKPEEVDLNSLTTDLRRVSLSAFPAWTVVIEAPSELSVDLRLDLLSSAGRVETPHLREEQ